MKYLAALIALVAAFAFAPLPLAQGSASAVDVFQACNQAGAGDSSVCQDAQAQGASSTDPIITGIKNIIRIVGIVIGIASVIVIIVSGIRFVTSAGDPQAAAGARNGIIYAAVGIAVAILSEALVAFVLNKL